MRVDGNAGASLAYAPNSRGEWSTDAPSVPPLKLLGDADHHDHRLDDDHWEQPGDLFRLMPLEQRAALFANTARSLGDAPEEIKHRHIANCRRAEPAYGDGVAAAIDLASHPETHRVS